MVWGKQMRLARRWCATRATRATILSKSMQGRQPLSAFLGFSPVEACLSLCQVQY